MLVLKYVVEPNNHYLKYVNRHKINTTSPALEVPNTPAVPPAVNFAEGHKTESLNKNTNQSKVIISFTDQV